MRRGPKGDVDDSPIPFRGRGSESVRFAQFCKKYFTVLDASRKRVPMVLRDWQRDLIASVWDGDIRPATATWVMPRGQAKSTLVAAMCVFTLFLAGDDASVDCVAVDERQAGILFGFAAKFIERHPDLAGRAVIYRDRIELRNGSVFTCLPATPAALEGRAPLLAICDEGGRINQEVYEVMALGAAKVPGSLTLLIGTPGPNPDNVLAKQRAYALDYPGDITNVYREFSAAEFMDHRVDCDDHGDGPGSGCWSIANPALGDFLPYSGMQAVLPPKLSESHFRRVRLCQWITGSAEPVLPAGVWDGLSTGEPIPDGSEIVLGFDGSYSGTDCTVIVAATVTKQPHVELMASWQRPTDADRDYRIPILEVEDKLRELCKRFRVREITADPYRWQHSLAVLVAEGLPVHEFPQNPSRLGPATADFLTACNERQLSHAGDALIATHLANAVLSEDGRGARMVKASRARHAGQIDSAVGAVMAYSRATWLATQHKPRRRTVSFAA
jgi:phage terminase large subunit-like protein